MHTHTHDPRIPGASSQPRAGSWLPGPSRELAPNPWPDPKGPARVSQYELSSVELLRVEFQPRKPARLLVASGMYAKVRIGASGWLSGASGADFGPVLVALLGGSVRRGRFGPLFWAESP
jgi:hypothetical protein